MNPRFKFRVWYNKAFHYDCYIKDDMPHQMCDNWGGSFSCNQLNAVGYDFTIQQYTGMKDLYDKEIWEGDIVQLEVANQPCGFGRFEVIFERGAFHLKLIEANWMIHETKDVHTTLLGMYNICCVIGNIYENPELAK